jgi:hypothetical protein
VQARSVIGLERARSLHAWLQQHACKVQQLLLCARYDYNARLGDYSELHRVIGLCFQEVTAAGCLTQARLDMAELDVAGWLQLPPSLKRLYISFGWVGKRSKLFGWMRQLSALESLTVECCAYRANLSPVSGAAAQSSSCI